MKISYPSSFTIAATFTVLLLAAFPAVTHAQFFVNGSFENPAEATNSLTEITATGVPGWTGDSIAGSTHEYVINGNIQDLSGNNYGNPEFGSQYLGLNAVYRNSFHSIETQVITGFTAEQTYEVTFYIANLDGAHDPSIYASASEDSGTGTLLNSTTVTAPIEGPYGTGTIDFVKETLDFTSLDSTVSFSFSNQSKQGVMGLDNFSVAAVPEPSTCALMLAGVGLLGTAAYRRLSRTA